ncbi:MAG: hypothetical protein IKZ58_00005, partial [Selenomonadaceae bacterium]|nr:hypothetical protein [Selenomonadaceae bacterium]
ITTTKGAITVKNGKGKKITVKESAISGLLYDDNFVTDTVQLDSVTEIKDTNYAVGKVTSLTSDDVFAQDSLPVAISYDKK